MARQFRVQSWDLYDKLGIKKSAIKSSTTSSPRSPRGKKINPTDTFNLTSYCSTNRPVSNPATRPSNPQARSPVNFKRQLPRPDLCKYSQDVNANRFLSFNHSPQALTNTKRISSPDFSLYQGRKRSLMYTSLEDQPQYDPNYSTVWNNTGKGLVAFNKIQGRKDPRPSTSNPINTVKYSVVDKKVNSPLLEKAQPKPNDPILPAFMLGNIPRCNMITQKTLQMNSYETNGFLPLSSGFGKGWKESEVFHAQPIRGRCPRAVKMIANNLRMFK